MKLLPGKIPKEILEQIVFKHVGARRKEVVLGPSAGFDGAVIDLGTQSLIVSMDPITGALERLGWLAVNVNANDIATFGVEPSFLLSCMLLPEDADEKVIETISVQMDRAAKELGIAIVGGHCEVTPQLPHPVVIGCVLGLAKRGDYVTAGDAKPGDTLILTKSAGIEGTAILAADREEPLKKALNPAQLREATRFYDKISVVKDAITAFRTNGVNAMHDPTEGGVYGGIHEMADASNLGVKVFEEKIRVEPETTKICKFFHIDPLKLISSGALLISAKPRFADKIIEKLAQSQIHASSIGEFLETPLHRKVIGKNGKTHPLPRPASDHLWRALMREV